MRKIYIGKYIQDYKVLSYRVNLGNGFRYLKYGWNIDLIISLKLFLLCKTFLLSLQEREDGGKLQNLEIERILSTLF